MCVRVVKWIALSTSMVTQVGSRPDTTDLVSLCFFFVSFYFVNGFVFWFTMRSLWLTMILLHSSNDNRISKKPKIWFSPFVVSNAHFIYVCRSSIWICVRQQQNPIRKLSIEMIRELFDRAHVLHWLLCLQIELSNNIVSDVWSQ